ncbi:MAG: lycopene cyclase domain-containing protein [Pedobacter sp.]|nr:MAG: lycopene cyclase domain-containing protein [Pedobacter sp.]
MKYTYLLINFFTIIVPFLFSFHPKLKFHKTWRAFFPAVIISGLLFILWDVYFTGLGVWGFNPDYLVGIYVSNLPIEEILFFFCIPYACVFTYHCLDLFIHKAMGDRTETILTPVLIFIFFLVAGFNYNRIYPFVTFIILPLSMIMTRYVLNERWISKFYVIYAVLLFPFLIVNGLLTGTGLEAPVVWYNEQEIIGFRIMTIPVEDVFYGMALILINLQIYLYLKRPSKKITG